MHKLLSDQDLPEYYKFLNRAQKKLEFNEETIDLFVVLDISGSMNQTCNKVVNNGVGYSIIAGTVLSLVDPILAGIMMLNGVVTTKIAQQTSDSRLDQAKKHLVAQINDLIKSKRINKLGLITFNNKSKIVQKLTKNFDKVLQEIKNQRASGQTALYDSIDFAAKELKESKNPRMLIMTDGEDNCSKIKMSWAKQWFLKSGLKSTFFTICQGNNQANRNFAKKMQAKYVELGEECWFSNKFSDESMVRGMAHLA